MKQLTGLLAMLCISAAVFSQSSTVYIKDSAKIHDRWLSPYQFSKWDVKADSGIYQTVYSAARSYYSLNGGYFNSAAALGLPKLSVRPGSPATGFVWAYIDDSCRFTIINSANFYRSLGFPYPGNQIWKAENKPGGVFADSARLHDSIVALRAAIVALAGGQSTDAATLNSHAGSYYLDYNNFTNIPSLNNYLLKSDTAAMLAHYALDTNVVHTTGNEQITGIKTFSDIRAYGQISVSDVSDTERYAMYSYYFYALHPNGNEDQYYLPDLGGSDAILPVKVNSVRADESGNITLTASDIGAYSSSNPNNFINQSGARSALSLTTTGSGAATYNSSTGTFNIPTPDLSGYLPLSAGSSKPLTGALSFKDGVIQTNSLGENLFATSGHINYNYTLSNGWYLNNQANTSTWLKVTDAGAIYFGATPATSAGTYNILTWNPTSKALESIASSTFLTPASAATSYVPYSGATANVTLGSNSFTANNITATGTLAGYDINANGSTAPSVFWGGSMNLSRTGTGIASLGNGTRNDASGTLLTGKIGLGTSTLPEVLNVNGYASATGYKIPSGTSSQLLAADGSTVATSTFATAANLSTTNSNVSTNTTNIAAKISIANFIIGEVPSGTKNGTNVTFTLANTPISNKEILYVNGVRQKRTTDYTISGATITMIIAPRSTDDLLTDYIF